MTGNRLSRRSFLKGAALLSMGGAAAGLAACTTGNSGGNSGGATDGSEITWDQEYDVVIIGSGYAGVAAATDVGKAGLKAVIIDSNNVAGGNSIMCGGALQAGGGNSVQVAAGIQDTPERFFNDLFKYHFFRAERVLLQQYVDNCTEYVVDWLKDLGLVFNTSVSTQEGHSVPCSLTPAPAPNYPGSAGISYWNVINDEAAKQGVEILLEHRGTKLIQRASDQAILGVVVDNKGTTLNFKANKAVILASGGFKSNTAMLRNWEPRFDTDISAGGEPYLTTCLAEMSQAAVDCGAAQRDMSFVCEYRFKWGTKLYQYWNPVDISNPPSLSTGMAVGNYTNLMIVKTNGKRFVNEMAASEYPQDPYYNAYLTLPERPRNIWAVADANIATANKWKTDAMAAPDEKTTPNLAPDYVAIANTIEELAGKMGV
ncbi:MAG: FAD-binding protein, partial [Actinomycetia bacterium]|nr:FAD-binding protein [Actinomycetes bacterium]